MGKGDKKTRRGKIFRSSYGNARKKKKKNNSNSPNNGIVSGGYIKPNKSRDKKNPVILKWFMPKRYLHFDKQLNSKDIKWVEKIVSNQDLVEKHNFYPLIHRVIKARKYKKLKNKKGNYYRSHYDIQKQKSTTKTRHIFYGNHLDSAIYSYYAKKILSPLYERKLKSLSLSDCISAYRKIKIAPNNKKGKNNIHFAKDVFEYIKKQDECIAIALDITSFFDNLSHQYLKVCWLDLLKNQSLPKDQQRVLNSLTNFSFVEENALLYKFGLAKIKDRTKRHKVAQKLGGFYKGKSKKSRNQFFRNEIICKGLLKSHSEYETIVNGKDKGIPQGLPISALLANIYLLEFDKAVNQKIKQLSGLYRRYSDDIILICKPKDEIELINFVTTLISNKPFNLEIKKEKSFSTHYKKNKENILEIKKGQALKYLGFEFNGKNILLKCATLSKYHRRKKSFIKRKIKFAQEISNYTKKATRIWTSVVKKKYSDKGTRNFLSYAEKAAKIMNEEKILSQIKKHKTQTNSYINKKKKNP